jgi:hypothetical protein
MDRVKKILSAEKKWILYSDYGEWYMRCIWDFVSCGDVEFVREFSLSSASLGLGKRLVLGIFRIVRGHSGSYRHFQSCIKF